MERLNAIAAKPPYQATDVLVFRVNFKLTNPNNVLAKVDDLYFEAKAEDGTPDKTLLLTSSMPVTVIPAGGEIDVVLDRTFSLWWSALTLIPVAWVEKRA